MYSYHPKHDQDYIRCRCTCGNLQNENINLVQEPSSDIRCGCGKVTNEDVKLVQERPSNVRCACGKVRNEDVKLVQERPSNVRCACGKVRSGDTNLIHEPPVKDTPNNSEAYTNSSQFPPPEPPNGEYGLWELQFCKWWGWTWVRKGDREMLQTVPRAYQEQKPYPQQKPGAPIFFQEQETEKTRGRSPEKKKNGGCLGFCSKSTEEPYQPVDQRNTPRSSNVASTSEGRGGDGKDGDDDGRNVDGSAGIDRGRRSGGRDTLGPSPGELKVSEQPAGMSRNNAITQTDRDLEERQSEYALGGDWRTCGIQVERKMRTQATSCYCIPEQKKPPKSDICLCSCHQTCYCCDSLDRKVIPCPNQTPTRPRMSSNVGQNQKDTRTQTEIDTREKATRTSQVYCTQCNRLKRCNVCNLPVCSYTKVTKRDCPVCIERGCAAKATYKSAGTSCRQRDKVVNYCLTRNMPKPSYDLLNRKTKTNNFSTMKKSLDILVKNNINIMHLLGNKSFSKEDDKIPNFLDSNISSLSLDENAMKSGQEHCTLLTAVCDAILSSHKFDEEKCNPLKLSTSNSTEKSYESRNSTHSFGFLDTILNDLNFPMRCKTTNNESNLPKDIGVQVNGIKKLDNHIVRPLRKLSRNKSKILTLPIFSKKHDFKSNTDTFKTKRNEKRKPKISSFVNKGDEGKPIQKDDNDKSLTTLFKSSDESIFRSQQAKLDFASTTAENRQRFRNIDELLSSIRFNITNLPHTSTRNDAFNLLDDTSPPPFTEYELPYNVVDENSRRTNFTKDKDSDRS